MSNDCIFSMKIKGQAKDIQVFYRWLGAFYDYTNDNCICKDIETDEPVEHHIGYRVSDIETCDLPFDQSEDLNEITLIEVNGCCAGSVEGCMLEPSNEFFKQFGYLSNYREHLKEGRKVISLQDATQLLNLSVEVFSSDLSNNVAEHIIVQNGELTLNTTAPYTEIIIDDIDDYDTYDDFLDCVDGDCSEITEDIFDKIKESGESYLPICNFIDDDLNWCWTLEIDE